MFLLHMFQTKTSSIVQLRSEPLKITQFMEESLKNPWSKFWKHAWKTHHYRNFYRNPLLQLKKTKFHGRSLQSAYKITISLRRCAYVVKLKETCSLEQIFSFSEIFFYFQFLHMWDKFVFFKLVSTNASN